MAGEVKLLTFSSANLCQLSEIAIIVEPDILVDSLKTDPEKLMQSVLAHDRVICEIFKQTTVLPLRFGTGFTSEKSLITHLQEKNLNYLEILKKIEGKSEYSVKLIPLPPPETSVSQEEKGRQYFLAKKQRYQQSQDFRTTQANEWSILVEHLTKNYSLKTVEPPGLGEKRLFILGDRGEESQLQEHLKTWQQACSCWQIQWGEALPPYHFVE